ncbi:hypothetical protein B0H14DRAFT_751079 [Mycena olivaceomarginata]|nr:hypothetical protein B0H14DRAFT_751079 [Mycena olivaceomarginata]
MSYGISGGGGTGGAGGAGGSVNLTFSPVVPNSTVSETAPLIPQPDPQAYGMMSPDSGPRVHSESGIYSNLLLSQGRGFPLYRPEPINLPAEYQRKGVAIGDVGTVTVEGDFDFFFNIYLSANNHINVNVPADFVPLSPYQSEDIKKYSFNPGNHVSTASICKSSTIGGAFVFNCMAPNGAVLALPHGGYLEKLGKLAFMRRYAAKNARSWYKYLNETRGCETGEWEPLPHYRVRKSQVVGYGDIP